VRFISGLRGLRPDVINVHWVGGGCCRSDSGRTCPRRRSGRCTIFFPFTGGCHFTGGCNRFVEGCGHCPQLGSRHRFDLSAMNARLKRRAVARLAHRIRVVTPCQWLAGVAAESQVLRGLRRPIACIGYCLDLETFKPGGRIDSRRRFGLGLEDLVVVAGASGGMAERRKGLGAIAGPHGSPGEDNRDRCGALLTFGGTSVPWTSGRNGGHEMWLR